MTFFPVNSSSEALKNQVLEMRATLDIQQSVKATLVQIPISEKQSFTRMYYQSYGLSLLHCELLDPSS